jgi:hypothetical protein
MVDSREIRPKYVDAVTPRKVLLSRSINQNRVALAIPGAGVAENRCTFAPTIPV